MNLYKLSNIIHKKLTRRNLPYCRLRYSKRYLRQLHSQFPLVEICEYHYCCRGEEHNCWIDVEGVDHGWIFTDHKEEEMPDILLSTFFSWTKRIASKLYKRDIFVVDEENGVFVIIPTRDLIKADFILTFKKNDKVETLF
ncbi:MAG: hypothetical protein NC218_09660 [Acetobacter sp.]|nr:hypothetical protein [Acetobacter sp.]